MNISKKQVRFVKAIKAVEAEVEEEEEDESDLENQEPEECIEPLYLKRRSRYDESLTIIQTSCI